MSQHSTARSKWDQRRPQTVHERARDGPVLEPFFVSIKDTMFLLNASRSDVNRKIRAGRLRVVKDGTRTKVDYQSVKACATDPPSQHERLPDAATDPPSA